MTPVLSGSKVKRDFMNNDRKNASLRLSNTTIPGVPFGQSSGENHPNRVVRDLSPNIGFVNKRRKRHASCEAALRSSPTQKRFMEDTDKAIPSVFTARDLLAGIGKKFPQFHSNYSQVPQLATTNPIPGFPTSCGFDAPEGSISSFPGGTLPSPVSFGLHPDPNSFRQFSCEMPFSAAYMNPLFLSALMSSGCWPFTSIVTSGPTCPVSTTASNGGKPGGFSAAGSNVVPIGTGDGGTDHPNNVNGCTLDQMSSSFIPNSQRPLSRSAFPPILSPASNAISPGGQINSHNKNLKSTSAIFGSTTGQLDSGIISTSNKATSESLLTQVSRPFPQSSTSPNNQMNKSPSVSSNSSLSTTSLVKTSTPTTAATTTNPVSSISGSTMITGLTPKSLFGYPSFVTTQQAPSPKCNTLLSQQLSFPVQLNLLGSASTLSDSNQSALANAISAWCSQQAETAAGLLPYNPIPSNQFLPMINQTLIENHPESATATTTTASTVPSTGNAVGNINTSSIMTTLLNSTSSSEHAGVKQTSTFTPEAAFNLARLNEFAQLNLPSGFSMESPCSDLNTLNGSNSGNMGIGDNNGISIAAQKSLPQNNRLNPLFSSNYFSLPTSIVTEQSASTVGSIAGTHPSSSSLAAVMAAAAAAMAGMCGTGRPDANTQTTASNIQHRSINEEDGLAEDERSDDDGDEEDGEVDEFVKEMLLHSERQNPGEIEEDTKCVRPGSARPASRASAEVNVSHGNRGTYVVQFCGELLIS